MDPNPARAKSIRLPYEEHQELTPPNAEQVGAVSGCSRRRTGCPALARLVGRPRWFRRHAHGCRLRRARPPRAAACVDDEDAGGTLGRGSRRARRRARGDAPAARGSRPGGGALPRRVRRRVADRNRASVPRGRRACVQPARPPAPAYQPAAPSGALVGRDCAVRRPAEAAVTADTYTHVLSDGREVGYAELVAVRRNPTRR